MWRENIRPSFGDTDALQHITNLAVLGWFEDCRYDMFKIFTPDLDPKKWGIVIGKLDIEFVEQLYFQYEVTVESVVTRIGTASFSIQQTAFQNGKKCAVSNASFIRFDFQKQSSTPLSEQEKEKLSEHLVS